MIFLSLVLFIIELIVILTEKEEEKDEEQKKSPQNNNFIQGQFYISDIPIYGKIIDEQYIQPEIISYIKIGDIKFTNISNLEYFSFNETGIIPFEIKFKKSLTSMIICLKIV